MFARKMMRPLGLALLMMVLILAVTTAAHAEADLVAVDSISITPASLAEPGEATVALKITNPTDTDMVYPVSLLDPDGNPVSSFGDGGSYLLRAHDSYSWEGKWNVSQAQLDAGSVIYTLQYQKMDETENLVNLSMQAAAPVIFTGERVSLAVTRTITPEVVRSGEKVTVKYELYNNGTVDLSNIRVTDTVAKNSSKQVASLPAGQRDSVEFVISNFRADHTSEGTVTYRTVGSSKNQPQIKVEKVTIPVAKPGLKLLLSSPVTGVNINEAVTLVVTFKNEGNISYSNVTVKDEKQGVFLTGLEIPAGETVTASKQFILTEPATFKVNATLDDNTGTTNTIKGDNELKIGVFDPEKNIVLTLNLTADVDSLAQLPMNTRFHVAVTNNSSVKAENISIYHGDTFIYTINSLDPDTTVTLDRDVQIRYEGDFQFTATVKDAMNNTVSFTSNTLTLHTVAVTPAPTTAPVVTIAPPVLVTPIPNDPILDQGRNALLTAAVAFGALFGLALVLFIISTVVRQYNKKKSNAAFDHLDLAARRDYTEPADGDAETYDEYEESKEEPAEPAEAEEQPRQGEEERVVLPHERLIQETEANEPIEEEGGYRMSRGDSTPVLTNAPAFTGELPEMDGENSAPAAPVRRRRSQRAHRTEDGE